MIEYNAKDTKQLQLTYRRQPYSNLNALLSLKSDLKAIRLDIAKDINTAVMTVMLTSGYQDAPNIVSLDEFSNKENRYTAMTGLITHLQNNKIPYTLGDFETDSSSNKIQSISFTGDGLLSLESFLKVIEGNAYLAADSIAIVIVNTTVLNWTFKGKIYE